MITFETGFRSALVTLSVLGLGAGACGSSSGHPDAKGPLAAAAATPIVVTIDAREAPKRIIHAQLSIPIPAEPGPFNLHYPKWIPGTHSPSNAIANLVGLRFPVLWQRDPLDMNLFHCDIPPKAKHPLEVKLDYLLPPAGRPGAESGQSTPNLLDLGLGSVILYPDGNAQDIQVQVRLRLPAGWSWASTLTSVLQDDAGEIEFAPVSLATLVDSPLVAGAHFKSIPITQGEALVTLDLFADSEEALAVRPEEIASYKNLVAEAEALFGAHHYRGYRFLVSLSDNLTAGGLGHAESSDVRLPERAFLDADLRRAWIGLLPREYIQSWNGKYRLPAGLHTADFQAPQDTSLVWIYEGLSEYLGNVLLAARAGLRSEEDTHELLAATAGMALQEEIRQWESLADTAVATQVLENAPPIGSGLRRRAEVNREAALVWLEADTIIRNQTGGKRSLDDFCRLFFGSRSGPPEARPYDLSAVLASLGEIAPYDWKGFIKERVDAVMPKPTMDGLENAGWDVARSAKANTELEAWDTAKKEDNEWFTLGLTVAGDGTISEVLSVANASMVGGKLISVAGRSYSPGAIQAAIMATKAGQPIELTVQDGHSLRSFFVRSPDGLKYPHLERDIGKPNSLSERLKARTR
jgi:predicted metalloprotease with PDZ domain